MSFIPLQEDINVILQANKELFIKLELLNKNFQVLDELQGVVISGNITEDANSDIRRNCSLSLYVKDKTYIYNEQSRIWMDKFIKIHIGIKSFRLDSILWYNTGIFLLNDLKYSFDTKSNILSITASDLMCNLTGFRKGQLPSINTQINSGTNIRQSLIDAVVQLGKISKYLIDDVIIDGQSATVPYDLQFSSGVTIYEIIAKLRDLYPAYQTYFDESGIFIFSKIPSGINEPIVLNDDILQKIVVSEQLNVDFNSVKNSIVVYGLLKDDGTQIKGAYKDTNPDSPFNVNKISETVEVINDETTNKIPTNDLANQRAQYECWLKSRLQDGITLQTLLIPWLNVNTKISYTSQNTKIKSEYIIKKIERDFASGTMQIDAMKFYPLYPLI